VSSLAKISFFRNFPKILLDQIDACAQKVTFKPGENVLVQGQVNNCLFFLETGSLSVSVDGGLVAHLNRKGDLLGEMSLLSKELCSATITAETQVTLFKLNAQELDTLIAKTGKNVEFNMYKIYSDILSQKLGETNQKAKRVEALNSELQIAHQVLEGINISLEEKVKERTSELQEKNEDLVTKNAELSAGHEKLRELYLNRNIMFQSMEGLLKNHLIPLKKDFHVLLDSEERDSEKILKCEQELQAAIEFLEPLSRSYDTEKSMRHKRVLLAESVRKQQNVAKMALGGTGVELDIVSNIEEGQQKSVENDYDIVIFDHSNRDIAPIIKKKNPKANFVFVTSEEIGDYVPGLLKQSFFPNVVSRDENDRNFTIKNFVTTVTKLADKNIFGLEKYLSWGVKVQELEVQNSSQRRQFSDQMVSYFKKTGIRSVNCHRCESVAEELLMNAIYDAPYDKDGKALFNHLDRTQPVNLEPSQYAKFRFATDGMTMAISVEDQFGGLNAETVFTYLERCFAGGESLNDNDEKKGGGGRGLHQILVHSDLVVFNIDPYRKTEVIAIFNADQKASEDRNPNLHFFTA